MGCGRNDDVGEERRNDNCICEVVRAIKRVQDIREDLDCDDCRTDCFLTPLGSLVSPARQRANTRVFMLLDEKGNPFKAMFKEEEEGSKGMNTDRPPNKRSKRKCNMFLDFLQSAKYFRQLLCNTPST